MSQESKIKKHYILQNMQLCKFGQLQNLPMFKTIKNTYDDTFEVPETEDDFCDVYVSNKHSLELAKDFVVSGHNPVVVSTVDPEFVGTNIDNSENMHDDIINLRTNFVKTIMQGVYPIIGPEVSYIPCLSVIRDTFINININEIYKCGLILACPIKEPDLVEDTDLNFDDYFITKQIIETIFQTAINAKHDVIILPDFGCKSSKNPLKDIVNIYNMCILKYGHMFKYICVAFHMKHQTDMPYYVYYQKEIIKPQELVDEEESLIDIRILNNNL